MDIGDEVSVEHLNLMKRIERRYHAGSGDLDLPPSEEICFDVGFLMGIITRLQKLIMGYIDRINHSGELAQYWEKRYKELRNEGAEEEHEACEKD